MTAQVVTLNDGWTAFKGVNRGVAAADTVTADLINILDTVDVPIVVVRCDLMIAGFNKAAADVLDLSSSDIGRAACDVSGIAALEQQCSQVITGGVESRVDFHNGDKRFVVRMSPYTMSNR